PPITGGIGLAVSYTPLDDGIAYDSNAVSVGDHHRTFEEAGFFHPGGAGHFTVSVLRKPAGEYRIVHGIFSTRKHGGDSGANRAFADLQLPFSRDKCGVANKHAAHVGDGVEFSWSAVKGDAEIAGAGFFGRSLLRK